MDPVDKVIWTVLVVVFVAGWLLERYECGKRERERIERKRKYLSRPGGVLHNK